MSKLAKVLQHQIGTAPLAVTVRADLGDTVFALSYGEEPRTIFTGDYAECVAFIQGWRTSRKYQEG